MPHVHYCDIGGHEWECQGKALRPDAGDTEPSVCMCMNCGVPMERGDHSNCPVELLTCPAHLEELERYIQESGVELNVPPDADEKVERALSQLETCKAACLWCGHGYDEYNAKAEDEHFAYNCPDAPEELREIAKRRLVLDNYEDDDDSCESSEGQDGDAETK
jgi:hypothetical protein